MIASNTCCKTGLALESCTEEAINHISHDPPTGFCRDAIKLCCLINRKRPICDKEFVTTSFDRFCGKPSKKDETCCAACRLGEQMLSDHKTCIKFKFSNLKASETGLMSRIVSECCNRKLRQEESLRPPESLTKCRSGFYFNEKFGRCDDINECEIQNNGCENFQECENRIGSYACIPRNVCKIGYKFNSNELKCDFDLNSETDTFTMESSPLNITLPPWKFTSCGVGLEYDHKTKSCFDIDECVKSKPCDTNSKCVNIRGSFLCQCNAGYELIEHNECADIDECRLDKKMCDQFCENTKGGYKCHCRRGFRLDIRNNSTCLDVNECVERKSLCSYDCKNVKGSFRCGCPSGYRLGYDRSTCEDINECIEKPSVCGNKVCNNLIGSYACYTPTCPEYFKVHYFTKRNDFR